MIYQTIDWHSKIQAHTQLTRGKQRWATKFCHKRLPFFGEKYSSQDTPCPVCNIAEETNDHFLQCSHYPVPSLHIIKHLRRILEQYKIDPYLRTLLMRTFLHQDNRRSQLLCAIPEFPVRDYESLLQNQDDIGWDNIWRGYASLEWDTHQRRYSLEMGLPLPTDEPVWVTKMIGLFLQTAHQRWMYRNHKIHGESQTVEQQLLLQRLTGFYHLRNKLPIQDQHNFSRPLPEWSDAPKYEIEKWLDTHVPHIKVCLRASNLREKYQSQDLRRWCSSRHPKVSSTPGIPDARQSEITSPLVPSCTSTPLALSPHRKQMTIRKFFSSPSPTSAQTVQQPTKSQSSLNTSTTSKSSTLLSPAPQVNSNKIKTLLRKFFPMRNKGKRNVSVDLPKDDTAKQDTNEASLIVPTIPCHDSWTKLQVNLTGQLLDAGLKKFERWKGSPKISQHKSKKPDESLIPDNPSK